jgi:hypothetical protein
MSEALMTRKPFFRALQTVADIYDDARPDYPAEFLRGFLRDLRIEKDREVLDIYPVTGNKLTRHLVDAGASARVLQPEDMPREPHGSALRGVEVVNASAERLPLSDASVDVVTVSNAFHWLDGADALKEIHRVLRPGGLLGIIYARRNQADPAQKALTAILESHTRVLPWGESQWAGGLAGAPLFGPGTRTSTSFTFECTTERLLQHVRSIAFVAAASDSTKRAIEQNVEAFAQSQGGEVSLGYDAVAMVMPREDRQTFYQDRGDHLVFEAEEFAYSLTTMACSNYY